MVVPSVWKGREGKGREGAVLDVTREANGCPKCVYFLILGHIIQGSPERKKTLPLPFPMVFFFWDTLYKLT